MIKIRTTLGRLTALRISVIMWDHAAARSWTLLLEDAHHSGFSVEGFVCVCHLQGFKIILGFSLRSGGIHLWNLTQVKILNLFLVSQWIVHQLGSMWLRTRRK